MPVSQKKSSHVYIRFIDYKPAELRTGKDWIIVYYAKNPLTRNLERFRLRVPVIRNTIERKRFAKNLLAEINRKLESGWSPFMEETGKNFKTLHEAINGFVSILEKEYKEGVKRIDTVRSYKSYLTILQMFVNTKMPIKFVAEINRAFIVNYLDYIYNDRGNSSTSFNNHLNFIGNFCNWLVDRGFLAENPTKGIQRKKKTEKIRKVFANDIKTIISEKLPQFNRNYFVLAMCTYYAFIRGTELTKLKVSNVNLLERFIIIPDLQSKNKKSEVVTIPEPLFFLLSEHLQNSKPEWYLFSGDNFNAGAVQLKPKKIRDTWSIFRAKINLPVEYQFYSLKDTGITDLLNTGIPSIKVRNQARHSDIKITEIYLHKNTGSDDEIKKMNNKF